MITVFWDMSSGGGSKLFDDKARPITMIFIHAPEAEARAIFTAKWGRDPDNVTCQCCGPDYSVSEIEPEDVRTYTGYSRGQVFTIDRWLVGEIRKKKADYKQALEGGK